MTTVLIVDDHPTFRATARMLLEAEGYDVVGATMKLFCHVDDLPDRIRRYRRSQVVLSSDDPGELVPLEEVERRYIMRVLEACGWRRMEAARILRLDRKTLYRKLERWGQGDEG